MDVQPAHISQIRMAENGQMVEISEDVCGVAADLKAIDPGLKVRFSMTCKEPFFAVYHEGHAGCPHNGDGGERSSYLVRSYRASQNRSGTWEGLDQRVVQRILQVGHSSYDYARELERANERAREEKRKASSQQMGELAEHAAHALRKDLGSTYRGRVFVP